MQDLGFLHKGISFRHDGKEMLFVYVGIRAGLDSVVLFEIVKNETNEWW